MKFKEIDYKNVKTYSIKERKSKVNIKDFAAPYKKGNSFKQFLSSLPNILASKHINEIIDKVVQAKINGKIVVFAMGAHTIKVGLNPVIIDLMERGIIDAVSLRLSS
jgi:hypothetical protein